MMDYIAVVLVCSLLLLPLLFVHVFLSLIKILCWQFAIVTVTVDVAASDAAAAVAAAFAYM